MSFLRRSTPSHFAAAAVCGILAGCCGIPCLPCFPCVPGLSGTSGSRSLAVPDMIPLGAVSRAHWHTMETNGEAADFVIHYNEFMDSSTELTPYGRDHIAEIAARMPSAPFPVIVQRSYNNSDPELDRIRRDLVVRVLSDLGNQDADQRTVVSQPYSNGINSVEGEADYGRFRMSRSQQGIGSNSNTGGQGGF